MAEASGAQVPPTFKLVLVGDGGTGKVCSPAYLPLLCLWPHRMMFGPWPKVLSRGQDLSPAQAKDFSAFHPLRDGR